MKLIEEGIKFCSRAGEPGADLQQLVAVFDEEYDRASLPRKNMRGTAFEDVECAQTLLNGRGSKSQASRRK